MVKEDRFLVRLEEEPDFREGDAVQLPGKEGTFVITLVKTAFNNTLRQDGWDVFGYEADGVRPVKR